MHAQGRHESAMTVSRVATKQFVEREDYAKFTGGILQGECYLFQPHLRELVLNFYHSAGQLFCLKLSSSTILSKFFYKTLYNFHSLLLLTYIARSIPHN